MEPCLTDQSYISALQLDRYHIRPRHILQDWRADGDRTISQRGDVAGRIKTFVHFDNGHSNSQGWGNWQLHITCWASTRQEPAQQMWRLAPRMLSVRPCREFSLRIDDRLAHARVLPVVHKIAPLCSPLPKFLVEKTPEYVHWYAGSHPSWVLRYNPFSRVAMGLPAGNA